MSAGWQVVFYIAAIVCFLLAAWHEVSGLTVGPIALGWFGLALVTFVLLAGAVESL